MKEMLSLFKELWLVGSGTGKEAQCTKEPPGALPAEEGTASSTEGREGRVWAHSQAQSLSPKPSLRQVLCRRGSQRRAEGRHALGRLLRLPSKRERNFSGTAAFPTSVQADETISGKGSSPSA